MFGRLALRRFVAALLLIVAALAFARPAFAASDDVQVSWRLLDYLGVDYAGAVKNGAVISASEYAEMREFSGSVHQRIAALPANPAKPTLVSQSDELVAAIDRKADPAEVQAISKKLASALLAAYPVALAPPKVPDLARGAKLFNDTCGSRAHKLARLVPPAY